MYILETYKKLFLVEVGNVEKLFVHLFHIK